MANPKSLKPFKKGFDERRHRGGTKPYVHLRDAIAESIKVGDVVEVLNKILIEKEDIRAIQELCKIMGWYAPAEQKITTDDHIILRFTDAEVPGHTAARGAEGSADESQAI
jgi:hypothetical protein